MLAGMLLYVMRHGPAEDDSPTGRDADRALTHSGRDRTRAVARALVEADERPRLIVSSPLVRACQTADIVALACGVETVDIRRDLAPGGAAARLVAGLLREGHDRVMIVGHEPDLSTLVLTLTGHALETGMQKAMVVGVTCAADPSSADALSAELAFVLEPKTLRWKRG